MRTATLSPPFPRQLPDQEPSNGWKASVLEQAGPHAPAPAALAAQLLEQGFRLLELFQQAVDVLHRGAAAGGDAPLAAALDDGRVGPLLRRHGLDDGLHDDQLLLVDPQALQL